MKKFYWRISPANFNTEELSKENSSPLHPLQSAIWGKAKKEIYNIDSLYVLADDNKGDLAGFARIEIRYLFKIFKIAWIPKGPTFIDFDNKKELIESLKNFLKSQGFILLVTDLYVERLRSKKFRNETILINLEEDEKVIHKKMHQKFKYAIRRSIKEKIIFKRSKNIKDINNFYLMCKKLSKEKKFVLPGSLELMKRLLLNNEICSKMHFNLELAIYNKQIASGAIIAFSDKRAHYLWGATNKKLSKFGPCESLHWHIIKEAKNMGIKLYDLEGIDRFNNVGVFKFKKRMGGDIKELIGLEYYPLNIFLNFIFIIYNFFKR